MTNSIYSRMAHDSFFRMGYMSQMEGDFHLAAEYYMRSIENRPSAEAHTYLGFVLSQMGALDHAIDECKKALNIDPDFGKAWNDIGTYHIEKRDYQKAIRYLKRAIRSKNHDERESSHYNLARVYAMKELFAAAQKEASLALQHNPDFKPARDLLGNLKAILH